LEADLISGNGVRAILFDFDGTLRFSEPRFYHILYDYSIEAGYIANKDQHRAAMRWLHYYWAQSPDLMQDMETYGIDNEAFWLNHTRLFVEALGAGCDLAAELSPGIHHRLTYEYKPESIVPLETFKALADLRQAGFMLAVVSNRTTNFDSELADLGLSEYFPLTVAAGEVNCWKPDSGIFLHAVEAFGICPDEALYVGDNYYADIVGARNAGLRPVLVDPDQVFPDAGCPVINCVAEMPEFLS